MRDARARAPAPHKQSHIQRRMWLFSICHVCRLCLVAARLDFVGVFASSIFLAAHHARERANIALHGFRDRFVVDELTFAAGLNEASLCKRLQVVRDCSGSHSLQGDDFAAIHLVATGNCFVNHKASLVAQGFRNTFDLFTIHKSLTPVSFPAKLDCIQIFRYSSKHLSSRKELGAKANRAKGEHT